MTVTYQCILCGGTCSKLILDRCTDLFLRTRYVTDYYRCDDCNLLQQQPVPLNVAPFYQNYPIHSKKSLVHTVVQRAVMRPVYYRPAADNRQKNAVLIDYGCGDGSYLALVHADVGIHVGFELSSSQATAVSNRLNCPVSSDLKSLFNAYELKADIVTLHFVLEHVTDLHQAFESAHRLLKPSGRLYIVIPHVAGWEGKLFGRYWHGLDPPRHISFPLPEHITRLAAQHGFFLDQTRSVSFVNGLAGSVASLVGKKFRRSLFLAALPLCLPISRLFPSGARAYWLTKQPASSAAV